MTPPSSTGFWARLSSFLRRHSALLSLGFLLTAFVAGFYSYLLYKNLRTDIEELLPESAPSVQDLKIAGKRFSGMNHLEVVIQTQDSKAGERFQIDMANRLRALSPEVVAQVKEDIKEERRFFERNRAFYVDLPDLEEVLAKSKAKLKSATKKMFSLGIDEDEDQAADTKKLGLPIKRLREKYDSKNQGTLDRFPDDYFQMNHGTTRVVLAFLPGKVTALRGNKLLSEAAAQIVSELDPKKYAPDMKVGLGGDVQNVVEENRELVKDLVKSFIVVTILVTLVVWIFFGTLSSVATLSFTLFVGVTLTFGVSYFLVGYLNANTAFLGSIVIGNGINFPIILLARYCELRRKGTGYPEAMTTALEETWKPTLAAAMAAGVSYGSLALTDFRGFSQFGVIGAVGMAACWLSSYSVLPAAVFALEKGGWMRVRPEAQAGRGPAARIAPFAVKHHRALAIATLLLSVVSVWGASHLSKRTIESDLSKLRNKESMEHGSGFWGKKTDDIFGRGLTPTIVLTDRKADTDKIFAELKVIQAREGDNSPFASISTVDDIFPGQQKRKREIMDELDKLLTPKVRSTLGKDEARLVKDFLPSPAPAPFAVTALPEALIKGYQETDGRVETVLQVYPRLNPSGSAENAHGTWNGEEVIRYTALLREAIRKAGVHAVILGQNPISADMLESIEKDGPKATLFAFIAVAILVVVLFPRFNQAVPMLVSLLLGVLWMVGAIGAFQWRINFLNFIALPITFGIGVDYSVNIFGRLYRDRKRGAGGADDVAQVIRETGGAVMLCSLTTVIGYGSLLMSGSQAFVSFGKLAVTGELTCIAAAIISLPSLWLMVSARRDAAKAA
ncbi:MAG: efflux RND transporter permease subunit [Bdellovibrionota bacterium]